MHQVYNRNYSRHLHAWAPLRSHAASRAVRVLAVAILLTLAGAAFAAPPVVQNVQFVPRTDGSKLADIHYDLIDGDSSAIAVAINASDDGGVTWLAPCLSLTGDVGLGVGPGNGKHVVWNLGLDYADEPGVELTVRVVASDAGVLHTAHSPANVWVFEYSGTLNWNIPGTYEKFARADIVILPSYFYWGVAANEALQPLEKVREINPSVKIVGYALSKTIGLWWAGMAPGTFARDMYERTLDYWSYTTTGDTLMDFSGQVVINILDPACRNAMVETIVQHSRASNNRFDGIFWDYFNNEIWVHPNVDAAVNGDPDMDGDGVPQHLDANEGVAYRQACADLATAVRDSLGDDHIQIFNGQRAYGDVAFASLADGLFYELFPTLFFPDPDMANALNPSYAHNLWAVRDRLRSGAGGPYIGLGNIWRNFYSDHNGVPTQVILGDVFRAVALLTDSYSCWLESGEHNYAYPKQDISLGPPLGPTEIAGNVYTRQFKYGSVKVTMGSGAYPNPFAYEIKINGRVVQALAIPYHFP
ncbi:MAG: hypothetical protein IPH48_10775 [bacterium]|nr:hypothetical protein [bacterium]